MATKIWTGATSGDYSVSTNWSPSGVPTTTDDVHFTVDYAVDVTAGLNQSGTTIASITIDGFTGKIGSLSLGYLQLDVSGSAVLNTGGISFIDFGASSIDLDIRDSASGGTTRGLYILGATLSVVSIQAGDVGIANQSGETSTVTTLRMYRGAVTVGAGATLTTLDMYGGTSTVKTSATTVNNYGGSVTTSGAAAVTTLNQYSGTMYANGTGTIATANIEGGELNFTGSGIARTLTALTLKVGGTIVYDPSVLTITTQNESDIPVRLTASNA
tara:strand:- start:1138 stop:1953 length:816 start_codon:yes stop_codon:yes gene_type:complete